MNPIVKQLVSHIGRGVRHIRLPDGTITTDITAIIDWDTK